LFATGTRNTLFFWKAAKRRFMKPSIGSMKTVALEIMCVLASATVAGLDTLAGTGADEREGCLATEVFSAAANLAGETVQAGWTARCDV
jgi:predicted small secreted protein